MIVLDTNVIIDYGRGERRVVAWVDAQRKKNRFAISTITVTELLGYPNITTEEIFRLEVWLRAVVIASVDVSIARSAAQIRRDTNLTTTDSIIAATALLLNADLATQDKDLKRIKQIRIIAPR